MAETNGSPNGGFTLWFYRGFVAIALFLGMLIWNGLNERVAALENKVEPLNNQVIELKAETKIINNAISALDGRTQLILNILLNRKYPIQADTETGKNPLLGTSP